MNNADYWARRLKIMEDALKNQSYEYVKNLEQQFDAAIAQIDTQMRAWYQRFADNNGGISYAEAQKLLTAGELKEFKWTVQQYIKAGKEHAISGAWAKELENASARVHISRLESLKIQLRQQAEALTQARVKATTDASALSYTQSYYHTAFEVQRGLGVGWTLQALNTNTVQKVLSRPWTVDNQTFTARCWTDKTKLVETVNQELTRMLATGEAPDKAIAAISKRFNVSKQNAGRVVMTESAYFSSAAQKDCFNELGVEKYRIVGTLDTKTCGICGDMDGKVFKMSDYRPGSTAPPFHPWCRCCTAPYFDDMEDIGERYSRDPKTGKRKMLPGNIKYNDWAKQYVQPLQNQPKSVIINPIPQKPLTSDADKVQPPAPAANNTAVAQGKDLVGEYSPSGNFEHPIEDVINTQGYDGEARVVPYDEFKQAMQDSGFYGERTYCAPDKATLDQWRQELYSGKWYVDCGTGGHQYGQGMYCAGSWDLSDRQSLGGLGWEMTHYQALGAQRGNPFYYTEGITLDKTAKVLKLPRGRKAEEYISDLYTEAYMRKFAKDTQKQLVEEYISVCEKIRGLTYNEAESTIDALYASRNALGDQLRPLIKRGMNAQTYIKPDGHTGFKDPGVLAAEMGYDVINAEGHGQSGSYTVILNRTKVIFCEGGSIYGN